MACSAAVIIGNAPPVSVSPVSPVTPFPDLPTLDELDDFGDVPPMPEVEAVDVPGPVGEVPRLEEVSVPIQSSVTSGIVSGVIGQTGALAFSSQTTALSIIESLARYPNSFAPADVPGIPTSPVSSVPLSDPPPDTDLTANFATEPDAPIVPDMPLINIGPAPEYDVAEVTMLDIELPDPFDALLPVAPDQDLLPTPAEPDFILPPVPTLIELAVPDAPVLALPEFDAVPGLAPDAPSASFEYAELEYNTALLTGMNAKLADMVADMTATGIDPDVEDAIWNRAADREAMLTHRATGEALRLMKSRGFRIPEASLVRVVQQALQQGLQRSSSFERAVAVERARLQQANFRFSIETSVSLESRMIDKANAAMARMLDAAKSTVQAEIQMFNAQVQLFTAEVQAFGMKAEVFKIRLQAALARIEVYRAELEAQRAIADVNDQKIAIYKAQIEGVRTIVATYSTRVDAAKEQISSNKSVVEGYRARIGALEAQVAAKATQYDIYAARVQGQAAKVQVFSKQVQAYRARVQAFDTQARAKIGVQELRFKQISEFPLALYSTKMDAYRISASAAAERLQSTASVFSAKISAFAAKENAKIDNVGSQIKVVSANAMAQVAQAESNIQAAQQNYSAAEKAAGSAQSNLRTVGQLTGQMAAAAIAAQSVTASISESGSMSSSNSQSKSATNSLSYASSTSTGASASTNTTYSAMTGNSVSKSRSTSEGRSYTKSFGNSTSQRKSASNSNQVSASNSSTLARNVSDTTSGSIDCTDITTFSD